MAITLFRVNYRRYTLREGGSGAKAARTNRANCRSGRPGVCLWLLLVGVVPISANAQVSMRTFYSDAGYLGEAPIYGGVALDPSGKALWYVNYPDYLKFSLSGKILFSGGFPDENAAVFGAPAFDPNGNAYVVAQNNGFTFNGTIYRISPAGRLS